MAEVILFEPVHGLTAGCLSFAAHLRATGHTVHARDLHDGRTCADVSHDEPAAALLQERVLGLLDRHG